MTYETEVLLLLYVLVGWVSVLRISDLSKYMLDDDSPATSIWLVSAIGEMVILVVTAPLCWFRFWFLVFREFG